ncbi:MAG: PadR family transcriptional regulator [Gemmatimonas sp.]|nr:PadR family transcriptional regulator [Gemmatimonas sp.]
MRTRDEKIERLLPLKAAWFHILLALGDGSRHGYAIRTEVEERTQGRVRLWPATLYGSIWELAAAALIEEHDTEPDPADDPRRRYYRLTGLGKRVLAAEVARMQALVDAARSTRALGQT